MKKGQIILISVLLVSVVGLSIIKFSKTENAQTSNAQASAPSHASTEVPLMNNLKPEPFVIEKYSKETQNKLILLDEIFASHNDNDPRLDSEFKVLSDELKIALQSKLENLESEKLNERGSLIFLLGRNIKTEKDVAFMEKIVTDKPCMSLENCHEPESISEAQDAHHHETQSLTLVYPQMVALRMLSRTLENSENENLNARIQDAIRSGEQSTSETVANEARRLLGDGE